MKKNLIKKNINHYLANDINARQVILIHLVNSVNNKDIKIFFKYLLRLLVTVKKLYKLEFIIFLKV